MMSIIDRFINRYIKEYDYYQEAARLCAQQCEAGLQRSGIRAIVTYRAKSPDRLKEKIEKRHEQKKYKSVEDIYKDIVDLAGIRIAIYFPGDRDEVQNFLESNFEIKHKKMFPESSSASYQKRFSGYWATHYRVHLKSDHSTDVNKRYGQAQVEIQIASVLMHAWAEVEHDLVYKPLSGILSAEEYAILDELNGLVLAGEIALERLQKAFKNRVVQRGKIFNNHYELSAYLFDAVQVRFPKKDNEPVMGRTDILYRFLQLVNMDKPECLNEFISKIHIDTEKRPVIDQIADLIMMTDIKYYDIYSKARIEVDTRNPYSKKVDKTLHMSSQEALGFFISQWVIFESAIREIMRRRHPNLSDNFIFSMKNLNELEILEKNIIYDIDSIRRLRNQVVHGIEFPSSEILIEAGKTIETILAKIQSDVCLK